MIDSDIKIFNIGYSPSEYFLAERKPYITLINISRWDDLPANMYCRKNGYAIQAFLCTFDENGNEQNTRIKTFKDYPQEIRERLYKLGYYDLK